MTDHESKQQKSGTVIGRKGVETNKYGETVQFEWQYEYLTPQLINYVGFIVIKWAWLDHEITRMCETFWFNTHPDDRLPQSFSNRADILQQFAADLYLTREPEEYRVFAWYLQRVRTVNGKRDDLAHGQHGKITKRGRTYEGLAVPSPGGNVKYIPMSIRAIENLVREIDDLLRESSAVSWALYRARAAAAPNEKHRELVDGVWTLLTWDNRSPKLPRWRLPPSTWNP